MADQAADQADSDTEAVARGSPECATWFNDQLAAAGQTQRSLAKLMKRCGDDRKPNTILRNIPRMALGEARVSGEMRVLLHFLRRGKEKKMKPPPVEEYKGYRL